MSAAKHQAGYLSAPEPGVERPVEVETLRSWLMAWERGNRSRRDLDPEWVDKLDALIEAARSNTCRKIAVVNALSDRGDPLVVTSMILPMGAARVTGIATHGTGEHGGWYSRIELDKNAVTLPPGATIEIRIRGGGLSLGDEPALWAEPEEEEES